MAKKKKIAKKGKIKPSMSHLEKEILNLRIENLRNKIDWRKEQRDIIKEETEIYEKIYEVECEDRKHAIELLENAISDQTIIHQQIKTAIPDVIQSRSETEEIYAQNLATNLIKLNDQTDINEMKLKEIKKKLYDLETYDVQLMDTKISEAQNKLKAITDENKIRKSLLNENFENILRKEMQDIFQKKILVYQNKLRGQQDKNFERINEETRWWENSWHIFLSKKGRLLQSNETKMADLIKMKENLKQRRVNWPKTLASLRDSKIKIIALEEYVQSVRETEKNKLLLKEEAQYIQALVEKHAEKLEMQHLDFQKYIRDMESNEKYIEDLETELIKEDNYNKFFGEIIGKTVRLIEEEVKYSLVKNYGDPTEKNNLLIELANLFSEATQLISMDKQ